jgi:predicted Zn-dependent protease with MMP-like domain
MVAVDPERFEVMVSEALDGIPAELGELMSNMAVTVQPPWFIRLVVDATLGAMVTVLLNMGRQWTHGVDTRSSLAGG